MAAEGDTFDVGSDTVLDAVHVPTGPWAADSWEATNAGAAALVLAGTLEVRDNNVSNGNRHRLFPALGADKMTVQCDFRFQDPVVDDASFVGIIGRLQDSPVGVQASAYEFTYDLGIGVNGGWDFEQSTLDEAWPGGTVTLSIVIDAPFKSAYANGILKVQLATDTSTGEQHAGIVLGNFTGAAGKRVFGSNFLAQTLPPTKIRDPAISSQAVSRAAFF